VGVRVRVRARVRVWVGVGVKVRVRVRFGVRRPPRQPTWVRRPLGLVHGARPVVDDELLGGAAP